MEYTSTRNDTLRVSASAAIVNGIAPDGGLYVPVEFPQVDYRDFLGLTYPQTAEKVLKLFLTDYDTDFLRSAAETVYGENFDGKAGYVHKVNGQVYALELWHGPTCAFKDYALQLMPRLLVQAKKNIGETNETRILVATSGDTGKAALAGYRDIDGIKIAVFYPDSGTSEIQRLQMVTQEGGNVAVYAVNGNFDDAQTGVKRVFGDKELAAELASAGAKLSSANSINWGRLVPQIVYYFYSYAQMVQNGAISAGDKLSFCVPTGNFGDILAGYYAKRMGLPVDKLICASNRNNVLTDFLQTGVYNAKREFYKTTSPSMDILVSSNLERLLYHISGSSAQVKEWMQDLTQNGAYRVADKVLADITATFGCGWADDETVEEEIYSLYQKDGYVSDTHTAVAFRVAAQTLQSAQRPYVVLSTASPYKFPCSVLHALQIEVPQDEFAAMRLLEEKTGIAAPASLACLRDKAVRFTDVIDPAQIRTVAQTL